MAGTPFLVAGPGEQAAEPAAGCLEGRSRVAVRQAPGGLALPGAGGVAGGQAGAAGGEHERIGGQQVDLLDRGERAAAGQRPVDIARFGHRSDVARGGDHRHVTAGGRLKCRVHAAGLRLAHAVLAADLPCGADRHDAAFGAAETERADGGGDRVVGVVQGRRRDQEDDQGGIGGERVHHLDVQHLLAESQPGGTGPGERGDDPHPRGRQAEHVVEGRHVLAHVGDQGRAQLGFGEFGQHHGLAAAVDPAVEERLDAVGHLELLRRVAGGERVAVGGRAGGRGGRAGRRGGRLPGWSAAAGDACLGRAAGRGEQGCQRHGRGQQSQPPAATAGRARLDHGVLLAFGVVIPPVALASGFPTAICG